MITPRGFETAWTPTSPHGTEDRLDVSELHGPNGRVMTARVLRPGPQEDENAASELYAWEADGSLSVTDQ